jgi:hypothetical protein
LRLLLAGERNVGEALVDDALEAEDETLCVSSAFLAVLNYLQTNLRTVAVVALQQTHNGE